MTGERIESLATYTLLGTSGLRVSPLCLGTLTFGPEQPWGIEPAVAYRLLDAYLEAGGNFIDTANSYARGSSESIIGDYLAQTKRRDQVVLATKFSLSAVPGDPNAGGNSRKNIHRALEGSLRRLRTDYIDLYWLHVWDGITPVEEVMQTLTDLVHAGKLRYVGLSDVPAWYLARAQTLAELRGHERIVAVQLQYSLVERNVEREHIPAAIELGIGVTSWSPLANGLLSGKYRMDGVMPSGSGRLMFQEFDQNPITNKLFTERNWRIVGELVAVAGELGRPPAQVALAWVTRRRGVVSTLIGATRPEQLEDNLRALEVEIPQALATRLDEVGRPEVVYPYSLFSHPQVQRLLTSGTQVRREWPWYR